jgi:hypothetical protein
MPQRPAPQHNDEHEERPRTPSTPPPTPTDEDTRVTFTSWDLPLVPSR